MDNDTKLLNWNVRGLNCAARREAVKLVIQQAAPKVVCLQETKLDSMSDHLAAEFLGYDCRGFEYLPADNTRGGILVAWDQDWFTGQAPDRKRYSLTLKLTLKLSNTHFWITVVYGPTDDSEKGQFLNELISCQPRGTEAWVCLGDFNLICEAGDKNNSNINRRQMRDFRQALDASELIELKLINRRYTWSNGRLKPTLVHLDRMFCNNSWDSVFPRASLMALSSSLSDHCPLFLCNHTMQPRRATFRFEQFWVRAPDFMEIAEAAWFQSVQGTSELMMLHNRLGNTAQALKKWSKSLFSTAKIQFQLSNEIIMRLETAQETRPLTTAESQLLTDLKHQAVGWAAVERSRRRQSSRIVHLREGDACTKFFHQKAKGRRKKNLIAYLKNDSGSLIWDHDEKEAVVYTYFSEILGSRQQRNCTFDWERLDLPKIDDPTLDDHFSMEEITNTIKEMPAEKAPGPDGYTGTFYKHCWTFIKHDIVAAMRCFHDLRAGPLEKLNGATIVLIPKSRVVDSLKDYRPISLIHSFGKLITKTLATRLAKHIGKLVSSAQSAFIRGRCIQDNFMYVRNLARAYHRTKTPALLFKLGISKAFDTVSWEYVLELLEHRGFSTRWRDWLTLLFKTSHSAVLLNGVPGRRINHSRGLRQGDPLSPYLFILAIDTLQRLLELATEDGTLSPLRGRHAKLRLSLYADDAVIFLNPVQREVRALFRILDNFGQAT